MNIALEIKNLTKTYGTGTSALSGVSLTVKEGDFFALLGPNGAGKTSIINIITGLVNKSSGEVVIDGISIDDDAPGAKLNVGVVPQEFNFGFFENVLDIVVNQAGYYGVPRHIALPRAKFYLEKLGLGDKLYTQSRMLSGGMKRRLMIARGLVHEPKLLILDEPTAGVDIELRRGMWEFLTELNKNGTTIILTTHYLEEAENLCRSVAIISQGKIVASGSIKDLLSGMDQEAFVFETIERIKENKLESLASFSPVQIDEHTVELVLAKERTLTDAISRLREIGINIKSTRSKSGRLEQYFISQTQKAQ